MDITLKAKDYAQKAHEGQKRKDGKDFFTHPLKVAGLLKIYGYSPELIAAGFLHDVVEDTKVTLKDMEKEFPESVVNYVQINTENKTKTWLERKQHTHMQIPHLTVEERALIAADKFANVSDIEENLINLSEDEYWGLFNAPYESQRWYYMGIGVALFVNLTKEEIQNNPIFNDYLVLVKRVFKN